MKRTTALVMALAMILSLAACGGNADQPSSNNTSPVTQGNQNQPTNPDNTQPSEPADTAQNEPQSNSGSIPAGALPLYDGIHYLQLPQVGETGYYADFCYTAIAGTPIPKESAKIEFEAEDSTGNGGVILNFGGSAPLSEQIVSIISEGEEKDIEDMSETHIMFQNLASGATTYVAFGGLKADIEIGIHNFTDTDQATVDCYPVSAKFDILLPESYGTSVKIDGQEISSFDDLVTVFGAPTAVYGTGVMEEGYGQGDVGYIWKFKDFAIITFANIMVYENEYDHAVANGLYLYRFTDNDDIDVFPAFRQELIDTLSALGLL